MSTPRNLCCTMPGLTDSVYVLYVLYIHITEIVPYITHTCNIINIVYISDNESLFTRDGLCVIRRRKTVRVNIYV
jgi:hypothetical protein